MTYNVFDRTLNLTQSNLFKQCPIKAKEDTDANSVGPLKLKHP